MATQLEERLRRYGETFERALVADVRREPRALGPAPFHRHRLVVALGAAACVVLIAVAVAFLARTADDGSAPVAPPAPEPHVPSLGLDRVWPGPELENVLDRSTPAATATAFIRDVLGEDPAAVTPDPGVAPRDPNWVDVRLSSGFDFRLLTVPRSDGWIVLQVGDSQGVSAGVDGIAVDPAHQSAQRIDIVWRDRSGTHLESFAGADLVEGWAPVRADPRPFSAVVTVRNETGAITAVYGGHFGVFDVVSGGDPAEVTVLVLNAGQPIGADQNVANTLRADGYNTLTPSNAPIRDGTAVQCRPGYESAAEEVAFAVGSAVVEPFVEPPEELGPAAAGANCIVYLGRV